MTNHQSTVIWLGLVLIALNVVVHIADLKTVLFGSGSSSSSSSAGQAQSSAPSGASTTPPNVLAPGPLNQSPNPAPTLALVRKWPLPRASPVTASS